MGIVRAPSWRAYGAADESAARSYRAADESAARRSVIPSPLLFIDLIQYLYIYAAPSTCSTASGYLWRTFRLAGGFIANVRARLRAGRRGVDARGVGPRGPRTRAAACRFRPGGALMIQRPPRADRLD